MRHPFRYRPFLSVLIAAPLSILSAPSHAQQLHERILEPNRETGPLVEQPAEGRNPAALRLPDQEITEPTHDASPRAGEQAFDPSGPRTPQAESHQRLRQWRPDLLTSQSSRELYYHSSFNPSISPHKRISALDQVGEDYQLSVADPTQTEVTIGGDADERRDLFWGSVLGTFEAGRPIPIPSVAPDARILSIRARPEAEMRITRDRAGNFYATSSESGQIRLVFVTDAPASYFGGPLPGSVTAADVPREMRPVLPGRVQRATEQVSARLGLSPTAPMARNLARLVTYLRSFETEALDDRSGGDPYLTLAFGRRGVCRHRAFVFVVTAQGLGIPARFVTNEVHAFAEAFVPTVGWVRIDLGGEALLAPEQEPVAHHQPRSPEAFPWPPGSRDQGGRGSGRGSGGRNDLASGRSRQTPDTTNRMAADPQTQQTSQPTDDPNATETIGGTDDPQTSDDPDREPASRPQRRLSVLLERHEAEVIRGESLMVSGVVRDRDGPVPHARVSLYLSGGTSLGLVGLGRATCDGEGRFRARFVVPGNVPTGDYGIVARAEGGRGSD